MACGPNTWRAMRARGRAVGLPGCCAFLVPDPGSQEVPRDAWERLFAAARREIGILVYSGLFLAEDAGVQKIIADKAKAGVRIRVLLGDPDSSQVAERGADEGTDDAMAAKIRNALVLYRQLRAAEGAEFGFTRPSCTTRSTAPTMSCWSILTSTAWRPRMRASLITKRHAVLPTRPATSRRRGADGASVCSASARQWPLVRRVTSRDPARRARQHDQATARHRATAVADRMAPPGRPGRRGW